MQSVLHVVRCQPEHQGRKKANEFICSTQQTDQSDWFFALHRSHFISWCLPCRERALYLKMCVYWCMPPPCSIAAWRPFGKCTRRVQMSVCRPWNCLWVMSCQGHFIFTSQSTRNNRCIKQLWGSIPLQDCNIHSGTRLYKYKYVVAIFFYLLLINTKKIKNFL